MNDGTFFPNPRKGGKKYHHHIGGAIAVQQWCDRSAAAVTAKIKHAVFRVAVA